MVVAEAKADTHGPQMMGFANAQPTLGRQTSSAGGAEFDPL
jgi:hypothetical protein